MPLTIIIRVDNDHHAREILAAGVKDMAKGFLPDAGINPSFVSLCYRTPEAERSALSGRLDIKETRSSWSKHGKF